MAALQAKAARLVRIGEMLGAHHGSFCLMAIRRLRRCGAQAQERKTSIATPETRRSRRIRRVRSCSPNAWAAAGWECRMAARGDPKVRAIRVTAGKVSVTRRRPWRVGAQGRVADGQRNGACQRRPGRGPPQKRRRTSPPSSAAWRSSRPPRRRAGRTTAARIAVDEVRAAART